MSYALGDVAVGRYPVAQIQGMLRDRGYASGAAGVWDAATRTAFETALGKSTASIVATGSAGSQLVDIPSSWITALAAVPARDGDSPLLQAVTAELVPDSTFPWPWVVGAGAAAVAVGLVAWGASRRRS